MESGAQLTRNIDENGQPGPVANVPYRQIVGSLMYLAVATRPDLSYVVSILSKRPSNAHWIAAKPVLEYLKGTLDVGITFDGNFNQNNKLVAYSDSDYASCPDT